MTEPTSPIAREIYGEAEGLGSLLREGGLRPTLRIGAAFAWTGVCLTGFFVGMAVLTFTPTVRRKWRHGSVQRWARGLCRIIGMEAEFEGPRPKAPFFLVANHLSYLDIILLLGRLEGVFVAKHELGQWPVLGYLAKLSGTILINRDRSRDSLRAMGEIEGRIAMGDGVIVFPEGTSSGGDDVYPMKPALFEWAARRGFPIHLASIRYRSPAGAPPASQVICWWGDMPFLPHLVHLCRLAAFGATVRFAAEPLVGGDRARLAAEARGRIARLGGLIATESLDET